MSIKRNAIALGVALAVSGGAQAGGFVTPEENQMDALGEWRIDPVFTVGETIGGYTPPGILDGIGIFPAKGAMVDVFVNHEFNAEDGYAYTLANGVELTGARITRFTFNKGSRRIHAAGLAYDTIYDRTGQIVTHPSQVNELPDTADPNEPADLWGIDRLCSANSVRAGDYGFLDDLFFTNEETSAVFGHPHGGSIWVVDVADRALWAAPDLGRATWENVTPLAHPEPGKIALLLGDDFGSSASSPVKGAPLYLYVGETDPNGANVLERNGLSGGRLYVWVSDDPAVSSPETFNTIGSRQAGRWVEILARDPAMAGTPGYDDQGYKDDTTLRDEAIGTIGAFAFSRPEDVATNPADGTQAVLASTGRGRDVFPSDDWGTTYLVDVDFAALTAELTILHDGDDIPDFGIRSPDNLDWAGNGKIYIQEDRATREGTFGGTSGREASIWELDPAIYEWTRIGEMNRDARLPDTQTDGDPNDLGDWESSGILDVTAFFVTPPGERLLIGTVQAHSVRDGSIGGSANLVQGGQLFFLSRQEGHGQE